jgi:quinol monooxygenase YgiN
MAFVQTIAFSTDRMDEMQALMDRSQQEQTDPSPGLVRITVAKDRDHEDRYMVIAEFESYELAMQNSARPETDAMAGEMAKLSKGPPSFGNYDVLSTEEG